jgi:wobble nucleotide-excising tRNase
MDGVASFKLAASLVTDKKINLIYGLNGAGKSTISNFLYGPSDARFNKCRTMPEQTDPVLVYNQKFIQENFFVADKLKGVFSLSKENKDAEEKISKATKSLDELNHSLQDKRTTRGKINQEFEATKQTAVDEVWKIKSKFSGGDRVLEYCLDGLKGQKEKLFSHLQAIAKPVNEPKKSIQVLRDEVEALKGDAAQPQPKLPLLTFAASDVESETIFGSVILGNADSEVAALIDGLGNSDWIKQGLGYLQKELDENGKPCPFCFENTITSKFAASIREYFDDSYQKKMENLGDFRARYASGVEQLSDIKAFTDHPFAQEYVDVLSLRYQEFEKILSGNVVDIEKKIKSPKDPRPLVDSKAALEHFNQCVTAINEVIENYNERLKNRETALASLKAEFWSLMRWQYEQTLARFDVDVKTTNQKLQDLADEVAKIDFTISDLKKEIASAQKETVNVDEAVDAINAGLLDLGIDGFRISKHSKHLYRVVRAGDPDHAFHTLSEGEKMMISFLYFCELCKGKLSAEDTNANRIVVIDDPISSLSHVFVFNVGQLIRNTFFRSERIRQVFVLTHSLYFFYELTDTNHDRRKENQKLFRVSKSASGSDIQEMKYEEIQNDYQAPRFFPASVSSQPNRLMKNSSPPTSSSTCRPTNAKSAPSSSRNSVTCFARAFSISRSCASSAKT